MNRKRQVFCEEYLKCFNQTEAARRADYRHPHVIGSRLMKVEEIRSYIDKRIKETQMGADEVLTRLSQMARADLSDFVTEHGIIDFEKVHKKGYLVKKITHTKGKNSTIELHDSQSALNMLGRHYALFTDKVQLDAGQELIRIMQEKGLTENDIRSHPLLAELFIASDANIVGVAPDGADSGEEEAE